MNTFQWIADGDSWCAYPRIMGTGGGLADHLQTCVGGELVNLSKDGDSSEETLGLANRARLRAALPGARFILFSSGGDDFAGDQFIEGLRPNVDGDVTKGVDWAWFEAALSLIVADYAALQALRDEVAPGCLIVSHSYGYPPAALMGSPARVVGIPVDGPWLQPGLRAMGWTAAADQAAIVRLLLDRFETRLAEWAAQDPRHVHVNLHGVIQPDHWQNELHLVDAGWTAAARAINARLLPRLTGPND